LIEKRERQGGGKAKITKGFQEGESQGKFTSGSVPTAEWRSDHRGVTLMPVLPFGHIGILSILESPISLWFSAILFLRSSSFARNAKSL
jgi:hypothetical protein